MSNSFRDYFAQRLKIDKGYSDQIVPELAPLARENRKLLALSDFSLSVAIIVDKTATPPADLNQENLIEIGKKCLPYTGKVNNTKMPVLFQIYIEGTGPISEAEWGQWRALRRLPGLKKVGVVVWYLDTVSGQVRSTAPFNGLLAGRSKLERMVRGPRLSSQLAQETSQVALPQMHRPPLLTYAMMAVLTLICVVEYLLPVAPGGFSPSVATLVALGADMRVLVAHGEWYRILSSCLLHADPVHLICNLVALWMAGSVLENLVGRWWYSAIFFLSALGGGLLSLAWNDPNTVEVGASGAIMGVFGAALVCLGRLPPGPDKTGRMIHLLRVFIPSIIPIVTSRSEGHTDFAAHLGGAAVGAGVGLWLRKNWNRTQVFPDREGLARGVAILGLLCFGYSALRVTIDYDENSAELQKVLSAPPEPPQSSD